MQNPEIMKKEKEKKSFNNISAGARECARVKVVYDYKHRGSDADGVNGTVWVMLYKKGGKRSYVSTGVNVLPSQWSDEFGVIGREDAEQLNGMIEKQVKATRDRVRLEMSEAGVAGVDDGVAVTFRANETRVSHSSTEWLDWLAKTIESQHGIAKSTRAHHDAMLRSLEEWGKMKTFADVRPDVVRDYISWLYEKNVRRSVDGVVVDVPITDAGVYGYTKYFRKFVRIAQEDGVVSQRAIKGIDFRKGTPSKRWALTDVDIERWVNVKLDKPYLIEARDRFVVQMATGLAFRDMLETDFSEMQEMDGMFTLNGYRGKTKKPFFLVILPMAVDVLKRWSYKVPAISNTNYNIYLGEVAEAAGIHKHVTSHIGRHTYACHILRHGVRMEAVQKTLGHSRISTTQIYAQLVDNDVVDAFKKYE